MSGTELIMGMEEVINYLKELEAERDNYKRKWENVKNVSAGRQKKIDKLKQENKRLQEEQLTEENAIRYVYENTDEYDDWVKGSTLYQKLQEENKRLQEDLEKAWDQRGDKWRKARNKNLEEENERLQEELLYYRFYSYTLDRSGDCDLTKEDVDYFIDDEDKRKTLYERIGYEEEDEEEPDSP